VGIWRDDSSFFYSGESGQWRDVLGPKEQAALEETLRERCSPELAHWIEKGRLG